MIIIASSFSKTPLSMVFFVHSRTKIRRFQITRVIRAFSNSSCFHQESGMNVEGRSNLRNKNAPFH